MVKKCMSCSYLTSFMFVEIGGMACSKCFLARHGHEIRRSPVAIQVLSERIVGHVGVLEDYELKHYASFHFCLNAKTNAMLKKELKKRGII